MNWETLTRAQVFETIAVARLAVCEASQVLDLLSDMHRPPHLTVANVSAAIAEMYEGVTNGHLSDIYQMLTGERCKVAGPVRVLYPCPCCERRTLKDRYGYNICEFCWWEDDGTRQPDRRSGANRGSMAEYRSRISADPDFYNRARWVVGDERK